MPINKFQLRPNESSDRPALAQIYLDARINTFTWKNVKDFRLEDFDKDTQDELIFVAVDRRQPVGFITLWAAENFVHHLYIKQQYQHLGLGTQLLDHGLRQIGRPAQLKCEKQNSNALAFYQHQGWRRIPATDSNTVDYHLLQLD